MERRREFLKAITFYGASLFALKESSAKADGTLPEPEYIPDPKPSPEAETAGIQAFPNLPEPLPPEPIPDMIARKALEAGLDPNTLLRISWCESRWDPLAINRRYRAPDGSYPSGLFQMINSTFRWGTSLLHTKTSYNVFDAEDNTDAAIALISRGHKNHWACR